MKRLWQLFDGLDAIELVVCGGMAVVMIVGGPIWIVADFVVRQRYLLAVALGLLWCVCIAVGVRDLRRKRFSWLTGGLIARVQQELRGKDAGGFEKASPCWLLWLQPRRLLCGKRS